MKMIISKKKFDEAIKEAVKNAIEEEHRKLNMHMIYENDKMSNVGTYTEFAFSQPDSNP